jgi:hypothetical protein
MGFFDSIKTKHTHKIEARNRTTDDLVERISAAINVAKSYTIDKNSYINTGLADQWRRINQPLYDEVNSRSISSLKKASNFETLKKKGRFLTISLTRFLSGLEPTTSKSPKTD